MVKQAFCPRLLSPSVHVLDLGGKKNTVFCGKHPSLSTSLLTIVDPRPHPGWSFWFSHYAVQPFVLRGINSIGSFARSSLRRSRHYVHETDAEKGDNLRETLLRNVPFTREASHAYIFVTVGMQI